MPAQINPETGLYEYTDPTKQSSGLTLKEKSRPRGMSVIEAAQYEQQQTAESKQTQFDESVGGDDRPLLAEGPGQFLGDIANIAANSAVALGTDYVDLALGVADVVGQTAKAAMGQGFDTNEIFDDSDNPLTQWRRETFKTQTKAGQAASHITRAITSLITLPKVAVKGLAAPAKVLSGVDKLGDAGKVLGKAAEKLTKFDDALKAGNAPKVTKAMQALGKAGAADKATAKAAKIAGNADWLSGTFADISKSKEAVNWWNGLSNTLGAFTQLNKVKGTVPKLKTVGQAIGWDAFVAFNIYGEGDSEFDETLTDALEGWGLPNAGYFQTDVNDTALERKWKQMAEGLVMGAGLNAIIDAARIYKYSRAFSAASPDGKAQLLKAFDAEAETLGRGVAKSLEGGSLDQKLLSPGPELLPPGPDAPLAPRPQITDSPAPALARLNDQVDIQRVDNQFQTDMQTTAAQAVDAQVIPEGAVAPPIRPPEPTMDPASIRNGLQQDTVNAFRDEVDLATTSEVVQEQVQKLLPPARVDLVEYVNVNGVVANNYGVINAADSVWMNAITNKGLSEGWATIDPEDFTLRFNRTMAAGLDRGDLAVKQAEKLDEAIELRRYEGNLNAPKGDDVAAEAVQPNAADELEASQARQLVDREAATAEVQTQQFDNAEEARLSAAEELELQGQMGDEEVVREMLGADVRQVEGASVEKSLEGRGWNVIGEDGETIGTYTRKSQALAAASDETDRLKGAMVNRARQMEADGTNEALNIVYSKPVYQTDTTTDFLVTNAQLAELKRYKNMPALQNANNRLTLKMSEMNDLVDGMKALEQTGALSGSRLRVVRNLRKRISEKMIELEPVARAEIQAKEMADDVVKFGTHGEFC